MRVITSWAGIAGAGVGVAACLPQAPGVIRTEYPSEDDLKVGGARTNHVRIISPRYEKICIGIDDTDTKTEGATWVMALKCVEACRIEGVEFLNMRLVQLNPAVPEQDNQLCQFSAELCCPAGEDSGSAGFCQVFCGKEYLFP